MEVHYYKKRKQNISSLHFQGKNWRSDKIYSLYICYEEAMRNTLSIQFSDNTKETFIGGLFYHVHLAL